MQAMPVTSRAADDVDLDAWAKLRTDDSLIIVTLAWLGATCAIQQMSESHMHRPSTKHPACNMVIMAKQCQVSYDICNDLCGEEYSRDT